MSQYTSTAVKNLVLYKYSLVLALTQYVSQYTSTVKYFVPHKYSLVLALTQYVSQSKYGALGLNIVTYLALTPVAVT
jgi:hypothetical protein